MPILHTLQSTFTVTPLAKGIALPAGAQSMTFFGTGGDGFEGNRVPSGPPLTVTSGTPVHSATYVSVGHQPAGAPTRNDVIDTGVLCKSSTNFPLGFTIACISRTTGEGSNYVQSIGDFTAAGQGLNYMGICVQGPATNRLILYQGGNRALFQLTQSAANWHFYAMTSTGGATPNLWTYEFTENQAGNSVNYTGASALTVQAAQTMHYGMLATGVENSVQQGPVDVAWGFVGIGPMTQANLAALAASLRPIMARRGITI